MKHTGEIAPRRYVYGPCVEGQHDGCSGAIRQLSVCSCYCHQFRDEPNPAYVEATDCPICPVLATDRDDALNETAYLRRREKQWAADVVWRANWMTRAINLLGEIREDLEHELTEAGHLAALEDLLHEEFDDGEDDGDE